MYQTIDLDTVPIKLTLARNEEPAARSYKTLDYPLPVEEEKALARRLFLPYAVRSFGSWIGDSEVPPGHERGARRPHRGA